MDAREHGGCGGTARRLLGKRGGIGLRRVGWFWDDRLRVRRRVDEHDGDRGADVDAWREHVDGSDER